MATEDLPPPKSSTDKFVATFNAIQNDFTAIVYPESEFKEMAQLGTDDMEFFYEPYLVIPRFLQLAGWMMAPSKNTNKFLFGKDEVAKMIVKLTSSFSVGDGIKQKVYDDRELKEENTKYTSILEEWLTRPCGGSGDNRGKTINDWVIPKLIEDNMITGGSCWYKFIGNSAFSPPDEVGKIMLKWLDPRTYVKVHQPFYDWVKIIQYPRVQWKIPKRRVDFERWNPTVRSTWGNHYNITPATDLGEVHIQSDQYYWFNLFLEAPMNTVIQKIASKIILQFLEDRFIEKATFPFFVIKVPRNEMLDTDDSVFEAKLLGVAELLAEYRTGDCFAIEGESYRISNDGTKITLSEGWEIELLAVAPGSIDFEKTFRHLNRSIAHGLMSSIDMIEASSRQGDSSVTAGGRTVANIMTIIRDIRKNISEVFRFIFRDVLFEETGKKIDLRLIDIHFSKIREEDAAQFLNQIISYFNIGGMTTNEARGFGDRIGMDLPPLPPEMTPEGQQLLGLDELLGDSGFEIPTSWKEIDNPMIEMEQIRDELNASETKENNKGETR